MKKLIVGTVLVAAIFTYVQIQKGEHLNQLSEHGATRDIMVIR